MVFFEKCKQPEDKTLPFKIDRECLTDKHYSVTLSKRSESPFCSTRGSVTKCSICCGGFLYKQNIQYHTNEPCVNGSNNDSVRYFTGGEVRTISNLNLSLRSRPYVTITHGPGSLGRNINLNILRLNDSSTECLLPHLSPSKRKHYNPQEDSDYLNLRCNEILKELSRNVYYNYPADNHIFYVTETTKECSKTDCWGSRNTPMRNNETICTKPTLGTCCNCDEESDQHEQLDDHNEDTRRCDRNSLEGESKSHNKHPTILEIPKHAQPCDNTCVLHTDDACLHLCSKCTGAIVDSNAVCLECVNRNKKLTEVKAQVNSGRKKMKVERGNVDVKKNKPKAGMNAPKKDTQRTSRPKTRRNLNDAPQRLKSKPRGTSGKSNSSKERSPGAPRKAKRSRTPPVRAKSSKSGGSQSSRNSSTSNHAAGDTRNMSTDRSSTHGAESSIKESVNEHEYLQFALRITEDIIKNDLYTCKEMKRVFNSHIEANRGRLDINKMKEQVRNLAKELNVKYDESEVYTLGPCKVCGCSENNHCELIYVAKDVADLEDAGFTSPAQDIQRLSYELPEGAAQNNSTFHATPLDSEFCEALNIPCRCFGSTCNANSAIKKPEVQNTMTSASQMCPCNSSRCTPCGKMSKSTIEKSTASNSTTQDNKYRGSSNNSCRCFGTICDMNRNIKERDLQNTATSGEPVVPKVCSKAVQLTEDNTTQTETESVSQIQDQKTGTDIHLPKNIRSLDAASSISHQKSFAHAQDSIITKLNADNKGTAPKHDENTSAVRKLDTCSAITSEEYLGTCKLDAETKISNKKDSVETRPLVTSHFVSPSDIRTCHLGPTTMMLTQIMPETQQKKQTCCSCRSTQANNEQSEQTNAQKSIQPLAISNICLERGCQVKKHNEEKSTEVMTKEMKVKKDDICNVYCQRAIEVKQEYFTATPMQIISVTDTKQSSKTKKTLAKESEAPNIPNCPWCKKFDQPDTIWNDTDDCYKEDSQCSVEPQKNEVKSQAKPNPTQSTSLRKPIVKGKETSTSERTYFPNNFTQTTLDVPESNATDIDLQPEKERIGVCCRRDCFGNYTISDEYSCAGNLPDILAKFFPSTSTQTTASDLSMIGRLLEQHNQEINGKEWQQNNKNKTDKRKMEDKETTVRQDSLDSARRQGKHNQKEASSIASQTIDQEKHQFASVSSTLQNLDQNRVQTVSTEELANNVEVGDDVGSTAIALQEGELAKSISGTLRLKESRATNEPPNELKSQDKIKRAADALKLDIQKHISGKSLSSEEIISSLKTLKSGDLNTRKASAIEEVSLDSQHASVHNFLPNGGRDISHNSIPIIVTDECTQKETRSIHSTHNENLSIKKCGSSKEKTTKNPSDIDNFMNKLDYKPKLSVTRSMDQRIKKTVTEGEMFRHPENRRIGFESHSGIDLNADQAIAEDGERGNDHEMKAHHQPSSTKQINSDTNHVKQ